MNLAFKASRASGRLNSLLAVTALAVLPLVLFWPALFQGRMIFGYDVTVLGLPFHTEVQRCLSQGQWPLWMPGILGGMPGIASCNLQFLYPTDLAATLAGWPLHQVCAWSAAIHCFLAGLGMFLFLRRLGLSRQASLLGALFFCCSGGLLSPLYGGYYNFLEGIALTPWAFWAVHRGVREDSLAAWGLCGLVLSLQILAGASQLAVYTAAALAGFTWHLCARPEAGFPRPGSGPWRALRGAALALILVPLISAPQTWLTLQYLPYAERGSYTYDQFISGSMGLSECLGWLVPGFFGWQLPTYHGSMAGCFTSEYLGLLPWVLLAAALASGWRAKPLLRWMTGLCLAALFLAQRQWMPLYPLFRHLPLVQGFRIWTRVLFLLTFGVCVLAAHGWDALRAPGSRKAALRGALGFGLGAVVVALLAWFLAPGSARAVDLSSPWLRTLAGDAAQRVEFLQGLAQNSALRALILLPCLLGVLWFARGRRLLAGLVLLLLLQALDLLPLYGRFILFRDPNQALPHERFRTPPPPPPGLEPWRIEDLDDNYPNNSLMDGYENMEGRESVPLRSTLQIRKSMQGRFAEWLALNNVRYVFAHSQPSVASPGDEVAVYAVPRALPRAWLAQGTITVPDDQQAYALLADPKFPVLREVALSGPGPRSQVPPQGSVRWLASDPLAESLAVHSSGDAALVLSNPWYPSWRARVDGADQALLKADGGLQALLVPAGDHRVDLRFDASLFYDAWAACLAGWAAIAGLLWMERRNRDSARPA